MRHIVLTTAHLKEDFLLSGEEDVVICKVPRLSLTLVRVLPHLLWGRDNLLLSINDSLMRNQVL
jgi:hypothetical protein